MLYEMIAGRLPFTAASATGVIMKHLAEPPPLRRPLRPELPVAAEQACLKALAKKPDDRSTDTPFIIRQAGNEITIRVDQRSNGSQWYRLGEMPLRAAEPCSITVRGSASGYANADAVALTLP